MNANTPIGVLTRAKHAGNCGECGEAFYYGDDIIAVVSAQRAYHVACADMLGIIADPHNANAVALGRLGGAAGKGVTSERKARASRSTAAKGRAVKAAKIAAQKANQQ